MMHNYLVFLYWITIIFFENDTLLFEEETLTGEENEETDFLSILIICGEQAADTLFIGLFRIHLGAVDWLGLHTVWRIDMSTVIGSFKSSINILAKGWTGGSDGGGERLFMLSNDLSIAALLRPSGLFSSDNVGLSKAGVILPSVSSVLLEGFSLFLQLIL